MNKADKKRYEKLADIGCCVCLKFKGVYSPPAIHHTKGRTKDGNQKTIPLCGAHHQTGGNGIAFHATGRKTWEAKFGTEESLLEYTNDLISGYD